MKKQIVLLSLLVLVSLPIVSGKIFGRKCEGNYALVKLNDTGMLTWKMGFFCPFGCSHGYCLSEATIPILDVKNNYTVIPGEVNIITFRISNHGTRGNIKLQTLEKTPWIKLPEEITLEKNETKILIAVVDAPDDLTVYNFTIVATGSTKFYAPSVLVAKRTKFSSTSIFRPISPAIAASVLIIIVVLVLLWKYTPKPQTEEAFLPK